MSVAPALQTIVVGVVVERRKAQSPWIDYTWRAVSVLPGAAAAPAWTVLAEQGERTTIYAGSAEIALFRTETGNYRDNLDSGAPLLWVALRPTGGEPLYELFGVSADPAEGEGWSQSPGDLVDAVAMPEQVRALIEDFVAEHHVEQPFIKRKRSRADPELLTRSAPGRKERE